MTAIDLFRKCLTKRGYVASYQRIANYYRIWSRDSMICSLAALQSEEKELVHGVKLSLTTLLSHLHPFGFIPENVTLKGTASYGNAVGRVDSSLWLVIVYVQYVKRTHDLDFAKKYLPKLKKIMRTIKSWEFNGKHLIYVPESGDWADEYIHHGYVLSDQVLYYLAHHSYEQLLKILGLSTKRYSQKIAKMIRNSYDWTKKSAHAYNQSLYNKEYTKLEHPVASFSASGYSTQFDGLGISLAMHTNIFPDKTKKLITTFVKKKFTHRLLPAFYPPIQKTDKLWKSLRSNYTYKFSNYPNQYHNGGLWPFITGVYASALKKKSMPKYIKAMRNANAKSQHGFYEYFHAKTLTPMGTRYQLWSAAGQLFAQYAIQGRKLFI